MLALFRESLAVSSICFNLKNFTHSLSICLLVNLNFPNQSCYTLFVILSDLDKSLFIHNWIFVQCGIVLTLNKHLYTLACLAEKKSQALDRVCCDWVIHILWSLHLLIVLSHLSWDRMIKKNFKPVSCYWWWLECGRGGWKKDT